MTWTYGSCATYAFLSWHCRVAIHVPIIMEGSEEPTEGVSSLRSRFENLNTLRPPTEDQDGRKLSLDIPRDISAQRKHRASPPKQRPLSMISFSPRQRSPPKFKVDSPGSPPKTFSARMPGLSSNKSPFMSPIAPSPELTSPQIGGVKPKTSQSSIPPPVNRAGKPKVPMPSQHKPQTPARTGLGLDLDSNVMDETRISPFSTPPSSAENTPSEPVLPPPVNEATKPRQHSHTSTRTSYFPSPTMHQFSRERYPEHPNRGLARSPTVPIQNSRQFGSVATPPRYDHQPNLPPRREGTTSGRTSPVRQPRIPARRSEDMLRRSSTLGSRTDSTFAPPPKRIPQSALTLGFNGATSTSPIIPQKPSPPAVPAARRSLDTRRSTPPPAVNMSISRTNSVPRADDYEDPSPTPIGGAIPIASDFPDSSQANRRPPYFDHRPWEIATGYDTRLSAVCGDYVCTAGYVTRVWSISTGDCLLNLTHGESVKVTALAWKPATDVADEGKRLWLGTNVGDIHEVDVAAKVIVHSRPNAHPRREIVKMYRHASELWTLDDEGNLHVWRRGANGQISLDANHHSFRVPRGHSFSIAVGDELWIANGKDIRVFRPAASSDGAFQVLQRPLCQATAGPVTCGATISSRPDEVYFGHADGKVSVYSKRDFSCLGLISVSLYKISAMAGVGRYLWAGYNTGFAYVYDTSKTPWLVRKDWRAHDSPFCCLVTDQSSIWKMDRLQVISLGTDNLLKIWDGMLEEDWLESQLQKYDEEFCTFREMTAAVMTWNAGASKPTYLKADSRDNNFFRDYLSSYNPPDIFVFGFQELVDLEDKKVTASKRTPLTVSLMLANILQKASSRARRRTHPNRST